MSISVKTLTAFLLIMGTMSCTRLSNSLSNIKLECGDEVDTSKSYIKLLDQMGQTVRPENIEIRNLSSPQANNRAQLTSKGCLQRPAENSIAILGQGPLKNQGHVLKPSDTSDAVVLTDISSWKLEVDCGEPTIQGTIKMHLSWNNSVVDRIPITAVLIGNPEMELPVSWDRSSIIVHVDGVDGPLLLDARWNDPFHDVVTQSKRCQYIVDKTVPKVTTSLPENSSSTTFRVNAGSLVKMTAEDLHLHSISYCIRKETEECTTRSAASEISFQAPSSGRWCLRYWATDRAGNQSEPVEKCGVTFQEDQLSSLSNALSVLQNAGLNSLQNAVAALRAVKAYSALDTDEERASIQGKVRDMLISLGSQLYLHGSMPIGYDERWQLTFAKGENWISVDSWGVARERDAAGNLIYQYEIEGDKSEAGASIKSGLLLNTDSDSIKIWNLDAGRTQVETIAKFPGKDLNRVSWNPVHQEFMVQEVTTGDGSSSLLHIFKWDDSKASYGESQVVPLALTMNYFKPISWSSDGNYLLIKGFGRLQVFKRIGEGHYELLETHEANDGRFIGNPGDTHLLLYQGDSSFQYKKIEKDQTFKTIAFGIEPLSNDLNDCIAVSDTELLFVRKNSRTLQVLSLEYSRMEFTDIVPNFELENGSELKWYPQEQTLSVLTAKELVLLRKASQPSLNEDPNVSELKSWRVLQKIHHAEDSAACQSEFPQLYLQVHHQASRSFIKNCNHLRVWGDNPILGETITFQNVPGNITPNPAEKYAFGPLWWIQGQKIWEASRLWRVKGLAAVVKSERHDRVGLVMKNGIPVVFNTSGELVDELWPLSRYSDFDLARPPLPSQQPHLINFFSKGRIVTWQPDHRIINVWQEESVKIRHVSLIDISIVSTPDSVLRFVELPSGDIGFFSGGSLFLIGQGQWIDIGNTFPHNTWAALALSPSGHELAVANGKEIEIYTWRDGRGYEMESKISAGFEIVSLQWDPRGEILVGKLETSKAYFWRFTNKSLSLIKSISYEGKNANGFWTADGQRFIINAGTPTLILDREIQIVHKLNLNQGFSWTALNPDGSQILIYRSLAEKGSEGRFHLLPTDIGVLRNQLCERLKSFLAGEIPTSWGDNPDEVQNLCK